MREIKFRAWMVGINRMADLRTATPFILNSDVSGIFIPDETDGMKIMQFTGLLDASGNEIYEGDIISYGQYSDSRGECLHVVSYRPLEAAFMTDAIHETGMDECPLDNSGNVIGNIYENPELIK